MRQKLPMKACLMRGCGFLTVSLAVLLIPGTAWCQSSPEVVEHTAQGLINWSRGLILAEGIVAPQKPLSHDTEERQSVLAEARERAWERLFQTVMQVRIQGQRYVGDLLAEDEMVAAKIREMVKNARVAGQEYLSDGTVAVTVEMNLYGGFSQLVLPPAIKQVESLKTLGDVKGDAPPGPANPDSRENGRTPAYTGLVVDARGSGCLPAIFPLVADENGEEIYGAAYVSREFAVQRGMSGYAADLPAAMADPRVTPRPMTVKGLRFPEKNPSVVVVSNADGARIRGTPEHLSFFKTCDVVIVLDPPAETPAAEPEAPAE
jgi:hypothetical protein